MTKIKNKTLALILAAGKGSRMGGADPKPLVLVMGKPMVKRIITTLKVLSFIDICVIVGHKAEKIKQSLGDEITYVLQENQKGTGHAVKKAQEIVSKYQNIFILPSDAPMISSKSIQQLYDSHMKTNAACSFLSSIFPFKLPYARVIRKNNIVVDCIEEIDADRKTVKINELFTSHYLIGGSYLMEFINQIEPHRLTGEYHLTDIIKFFSERNYILNGIQIACYQELMGINTKEDLDFIESWLESYDN